MKKCNQPSYPVECDKSRWGESEKCIDKRDMHIEQSGSPVFAHYPLSSSRYNFDETPLVCDGTNGYWATDYLTGDQYYAAAPGENCSFTCKDPLYRIWSFNNRGAFKEGFDTLIKYLTVLRQFYVHSGAREQLSPPNHSRQSAIK